MELNDAIEASLAAVEKFYGDAPVDIRLEEITVPDHTPHGDWEVTVGFLMPNRNQSPFTALRVAIEAPKERVYKRLRFDNDTGEFVSMENRLTI